MVEWWVTVFVTHHRATVLRSFGKYRKSALTKFHRGLTKCQVEVKRNTNGVNVDKLSTLIQAAAIHPMWSKCPHGVSRNAEGYSGEWRFASFTGFGNKKSPHNNLNLTIPSGMALVRVCYVAIRKLKTCSGSFGSRAGTLSKYVILNCWDRLP